MFRTAHPLVSLLLPLALTGCELIADFDRDKIPAEMPDAGMADASMADAALDPDAAMEPEPDAAVPPDAGDGAPDQDAGEDDAGEDDAG